MKVEIWSDIACPWCFIGKRRFERALEKAELDAEIVWRSFELDPGAPQKSELPLDEMLARKYRVDIEQARSMLDQMTEAGELEDIEFKFDQIEPTNTFDAHRLIHFASTQGKGDSMKERLLKAYFTEGQNLGDTETLVGLGEEVGLEAADVREMLESESCSTQVREDELKARQMGVHGVPFFLIDGKYSVPGAQMPEVWADAFRQVAKREAESEIPSDAACGPDGCAVDGGVEKPQQL